MVEMLRGAAEMRWRLSEGALHEDEAALAGNEIYDVDMFVDRGSGCIGRMNALEDFTVELFPVEIAADCDE